ncbi:Prophage integrase IntA [Sphingobium sp. AntQ-1]|uniref:tyrosine-type recombinase/integrase n=1 Tax=Sphingobium sp. AntQ-1 TaxID=2930091 RepID=UPI00234F752C|nr:site-specific integrase [Sphingobium sp. AntQ-1]WCP13066.1 Prophage integrase IntA [Sphingobium sp. AntQ-1]
MGKLSVTGVKAAKRPGRFGDGDGLFLVVGATGSKSWVCRVQKHGRRRDIGLGSASKVTLSVARDRAREVRTWVELGLDPVFEKRKASGIPTFREATAKVYAANRKTWRNEKHEGQWLRTLEAFAFPIIGDIRVSEINGPMIRNVLAEIWLTKPETARRLRQRIGAVLDWAFASGYRETEAPMRSITKGLPRQPKKDGHFAAMPYADVAAFMARLRERESFSRLALQFAILTAARSGEVRGAAWTEIDVENALWTIPKERMKAQREHVVPLSRPSIRIIERCSQLRTCECPLIFPGMKGDKPLSDMTLTKLLREMKQPYTAHGFRSAFRDWASEETDVQGEVAEAALAHMVRDKTEAAYRRGSLLEKRRKLMDDWSTYCTTIK